MGKLVWCSDIHLDFIARDERDKFYAKINSEIDSSGAERLLLTGDVSTGNFITIHLGELAESVKVPISFVLGNHDYYNTNIEWTRSIMEMMSLGDARLSYLPSANVVHLSDSTALVGHDGWYDARHGTHVSRIVMNDWIKIANYAYNGAIANYRPNYDAILKLSRHFAEVGANHVASAVDAAAATHDKIIVATHFPPFVDAHVHDGKKAGDEHLPWYTSKVMGDTLLELAARHSDKKIEVYCGHTHAKKSVTIAHNLEVHVAGAEYNSPAIAGVIQFD